MDLFSKGAGERNTSTESDNNHNDDDAHKDYDRRGDDDRDDDNDGDAEGILTESCCTRACSSGLGMLEHNRVLLANLKSIGTADPLLAPRIRPAVPIFLKLTSTSLPFLSTT